MTERRPRSCTIRHIRHAGMMIKLALTLDEAAEASGYSRRVIQIAIARHELIPSYANSKPVIRVAELDRWLESLPSEPR